jgi:hypothetical protein
VDLSVYLRVLWRFRLLAVAGLLLAVGLAFLSMVRISGDGFSYREKELWSSSSQLLVTQKGFPWGRATALENELQSQAEQFGSRFAPPERFTSLAVLYAELAMSDPVKQIMLKDGPMRGEIQAFPVATESSMLPLVQMVATSEQPALAVSLADRATEAIRDYLMQEQEANDVPPQDRVVVQVLSQADEVELSQARSKTRPMIIFLTVMVLTLGLIFVLENLKPRIRPVHQQTPEVGTSSARRSA